MGCMCVILIVFFIIVGLIEIYKELRQRFGKGL